MKIICKNYNYSDPYSILNFTPNLYELLQPNSDPFNWTQDRNCIFARNSRKKRIIQLDTLQLDEKFRHIQIQKGTTPILTISLNPVNLKTIFPGNYKTTSTDLNKPLTHNIITYIDMIIVSKPGRMIYA